MTIHIGIVVGEPSGDVLGSLLIEALKQHFPEAHFSGMGGDKMLLQGFEQIYSPDPIAVMGLADPLKRLPSILSLRRNLLQYFLKVQPDVVISIDSPDFNLGLQLKLRQNGIKTVHYVSPSVWAWRKGRIKKIAKAVDLMLTLFPFETSLYEQEAVPVACVGHPLADTLPLEPDRQRARQRLEIDKEVALIAILAGSRQSEINHLLPIFLRVAVALQADNPDLEFIIPAVDYRRQIQIEGIIQTGEFDTKLTIHYSMGNSIEAMTAANLGLLTSGTVTLEAMLLKLPMVVAYYVAPWQYYLLKPFIKTRFFALPNLLANELLVPEWLQKQIKEETIKAQLHEWLHSTHRCQQLKDRFLELHKTLRTSSQATASSKIAELILGTSY